MNAAMGLQVRPQLAQEERVASRPIPEQGGGSTHRRRGHPRLPPDVFGDGVGVQSAQVEASYALLPVHLCDPFGQLVRTIGRCCTKRPDHEQREIDCLASHMLQQRQRGSLRPMQIVEDDQHRHLGTHGTKQPDDGIEQLPPDLRRDRGSFVAGDMPGNVTGETSEVGAGQRHVLFQRAGFGGEEDLIQDLGEGLIRNACVLRGHPVQPRHAVRMENTCDLGRQAGLSCPWLAANEHDLAVTGGDPFPDTLEDPQLLGTADERTQPHGGETSGERGCGPCHQRPTVPWPRYRRR